MKTYHVIFLSKNLIFLYLESKYLTALNDEPQQEFKSNSLHEIEIR